MQTFGITPLVNLCSNSFTKDHLAAVSTATERFGLRNVFVTSGYGKGEPLHLTHQRRDPNAVLQCPAVDEADRAFSSVTALLKHLKENFSFSLGVATKVEFEDAADMDKEIQRLLEKQAAGATYAIAQFIFNAASFFEFRSKAEAQGVVIPIVPSVLVPPVCVARHHRQSPVPVFIHMGGLHAAPLCFLCSPLRLWKALPNTSMCRCQRNWPKLSRLPATPWSSKRALGFNLLLTWPMR